jgi:predicted transglutaminase-like cysteine proteinase
MAHVPKQAAAGTWRAGAAAALGMAGWLVVAIAPDARAMQIFGTDEYAVGSGGAYPRFTDMMQRYQREYRGAAECPGSGLPVCLSVGEWSGFIASLGDLDPLTQLVAVNDYFNRYAYVSDTELWGQLDYWETPLEFLARGAGDCEGFAVAKYYTLRALGFAATDMRIVVVMDYQRGVQHAVLAVAVGGEVLVLDNLAGEVAIDREIGHYEPLMSINEAGIWLPM